MSLTEAFLAEFDNESSITRRFLERVPQDRLTWKPHDKSMSAGQLALHIASAPATIMQIASLDTIPAPDFNNLNPQPASVDEILAAHDNAVATARSMLKGMDDAKLAALWSMTANGEPVLTMPRAAVIRNILLNHLIQHRGQLSVYLRLLGQKVPASYGPSADEPPTFMQAAGTA